MVVIAVMPAAGLMISLGNIIQIFGADVAMLVRVGTIVANIGWGVINNLNLLFAVAIGGSWPKSGPAAPLRRSSRLSSSIC